MTVPPLPPPPTDLGAGGGLPDPPLPPPRTRPTARSVTLAVSLLLSAVLVAGLAVLPAPYAVESPGPTKDVLGKVDGKPLISISGAERHTPTGELRLTTVSEVGSPGYPAYALSVLLGWASRWSVVQPTDQHAVDTSQKEIDSENQQQMVSSQELATAAALTELGYQVPATLTVGGVVDGSGAAGVLQKGDVVTALDGTALPDYRTLIATLQATAAGATVTVTVTRDGRTLDLPVVTTARDGGGALLGILVDPTFHPPVDVTINLEGIGGPSAGTMFALGIIDLLTPQDEANGQDIAGTGTIDALGDVGAIGGIAQKMAGASRDGATWFLAPRSNCSEVVGHVPSGLHVVAVSTLHEAREDVVAIGAGHGATLPTCTPGS